METVEQYLPLVAKCARVIKKRHGRHVDYDDLFQNGFIGLVTAMRRFNPESGARFKTYATKRINFAIIDAMRIESEFRRRSVNKVSVRSLEDEICEGVSISDRVPDGSASQGIERVDDRDQIERLSKTLSDSERDLIRQRFTEHKTLEEIGGHDRKSKQLMWFRSAQAMGKLRRVAGIPERTVVNRKARKSQRTVEECNKMAADNFGLVRAFVRRQPEWIDRHELLSMSMLAFVRASRAWNPLGGAKFPHFAIRYMRCALGNWLRNRKTKPLPRFATSDFDDVPSVGPSPEENALRDEAVSIYLGVGLAVLDKRELSMFIGRFGNDDILDDVGDGCSRERVRQIVDRAMKKVRGRIAMWRSLPLGKRNELPTVDVKKLLNRYAGPRSGLKQANGNTNTRRKRQGADREDGPDAKSGRGDSGGRQGVHHRTPAKPHREG